MGTIRWKSSQAYVTFTHYLGARRSTAGIVKTTGKVSKRANETDIRRNAIFFVYLSRRKILNKIKILSNLQFFFSVPSRGGDLSTRPLVRRVEFIFKFVLRNCDVLPFFGDFYS